ncbi:hypothetical protein MES5069_520067 [Mesorhizobium escarrei]|uniref:Uncharacterized protein n=1 Tax=Mesorhizobium escarrei TaxID=666018 RepID=A0ABN8KCE2_9HYPH|nr:hypothetical protein MES5069_520067 [Mesorhizobium escarrei]
MTDGGFGPSGRSGEAHAGQSRADLLVVEITFGTRDGTPDSTREAEARLRRVNSRP